MASSIQEFASQSHRNLFGPAPNCVTRMVSAQAMRRPDAPAIMAGDRVLTYDQLDCQSSRLAHYLRSLGIAPGTPVGMCLPQSLEMAVAALGILKAGAACVPLDPASPPKRLAQILEQVNVEVNPGVTARFLVTTHSAMAGNGAVSGCRVVLLEEAGQSAFPDYPPKTFI